MWFFSRFEYSKICTCQSFEYSERPFSTKNLKFSSMIRVLDLESIPMSHLWKDLFIRIHQIYFKSADKKFREFLCQTSLIRKTTVPIKIRKKPNLLSLYYTCSQFIISECAYRRNWRFVQTILIDEWTIDEYCHTLVVTFVIFSFLNKSISILLQNCHFSTKQNSIPFPINEAN